MLYQEYYHKVLQVLDHAIGDQAEKLQKTAALVADTLAADGLIYLFGCGHSHIVAEDLFYRAGGLAPVYPILDSALMLHDGAVKSSCLERMCGLADPLFKRFPITQRDILFVVSTSGINSVPIEMARCAQEKGITVVTVVSQAYAQDTSRHPSGKKLSDFADIVLDNGVCHGDAAVEIGTSGIHLGPISTISACTIMQAIVVQASQMLWEKGVEPPVYVSGNVQGGMEKNMDLIERYRSRIRFL